MFKFNDNEYFIKPTDTFSIPINISPITFYCVGLKFESKIKAKWKKRKERLSTLRKIKIKRSKGIL